ncbi:MAG TPA: RidA family protein [Xanthobacteraceae bacterium]|jgi:reactive intermediate/imine deaminase
MTKRAVESANVASTKGPYAQGIEVTRAKLVFTSGVVARDAGGTILGKGDTRAQTRQCIENIRHIIEAAGGSLSDLVKVTVFLRDLKDYEGMNEARREMLGGIAFASSTVQAGLNAADAMVEIEAVAAVPVEAER